MSPSTRTSVAIIGSMAVVLAAAVAIRLVPALARYRQTLSGAPRSVVIRRPNELTSTLEADRDQHGGLANIGPLATVSVSSDQEGNVESAAGVADGTADAREWAAAGMVQDAWIRLTWDHPATIAEVELYDRRSMLENILKGTLIFEDGSTIPVPALPPDGSPSPRGPSRARPPGARVERRPPSSDRPGGAPASGRSRLRFSLARELVILARRTVR